MDTKPNADTHSLDGIDDDYLVDEKEFSRIIGRAPSTLRHDRQQGTGFTYFKFGKLVRYSPKLARKEAMERYRRTSTTNTEPTT